MSVLAANHFVAPGRVFYAGILALVIVVVLTPAVGGLARRIGAVDDPGNEARRLHVIPIPRLGGLAIFFGIFVPLLAFENITRPVRGILLGAAIATMVGALDDARGLRWWQKLGGQIGAAVALVSFGVWVDRFTFPIVGVQSLPAWVGIPATIFWVVAIMNMVNFLDGLDGLAAGVCAIASGTFAVIALSLGKVPPAVLAAVVCGASIGFLRHNFYPARIFMGDSGAMLLGFVLAAVSVQGLLKTAATVALALPLLVLAIPIMDTSFVVLRRLKYRRPITEADAGHLHHRFINLGFTQRRAVLTMYVWSATLAGAALATRFIPPRPHGHWQLVPTFEAGAIGLAALATSVYVVYLLEIVKFANPRIKRRAAEAERRRSA